MKIGDNAFDVSIILCIVSLSDLYPEINVIGLLLFEFETHMIFRGIWKTNSLLKQMLKATTNVLRVPSMEVTIVWHLPNIKLVILRWTNTLSN